MSWRIQLFLLVLLTNFNVAAQCDFEKIKQIKLSGEFYFGEAISKDSTSGIDLARKEMFHQIAQLYIDKKIPNFEGDSIMHINKIAYCISSYSSRYKTLAYIAKDRIIFNRETTPRKEFKIVKMSYQDSVIQSKVQPKQEKQSNPQEVIIQRNIIDSIVKMVNETEIENFLVASANKNKLAFAYKENKVDNVLDCYVLAINSNRHMTACLTKGNTRKNLLNNTEVNDFKKEFPNHHFIWVYVY